MARKGKTPPESSPRRSRRAALRTVSKVATLSQRRTHFERVVQHHVTQRKTDAPPELWKFDQSVLQDEHPSLDPDDVEKLLDDLDTASHNLCAILLRLRKVPNDASDADNDEEMRDEEAQEDDNDKKDDLSESELSDLPNIAQVLANDSFISHQSHEIRLFTACALAEIMRISAPKAPLSESKLKAVCNLFIDELTVIAFADDHLKSFRFALLEQLAAVKTFAIFSEEVHVIADIFACFYASVRPHQAEKYKEHLGFILITLLTEVETIDQTLLDALLAPLARDPTQSSSNSLKSLSAYSTSAVELASYVLVNAKNQLQVPICNFFNSALQKLSKGRVLPDKRGPGRRKAKEDTRVDDDDPDYENLVSDLSEDIEKLVVTVNQIAPGILLYVIPSLEERLRAKDPVVRRNVAHLLGKLFMSSSATVNAYPSVFTEFLHRARDIEPSLRVEVCQTLGPLIVSNPRQRATLNKALLDRVLDHNENVREAVAISVGQTESFASSELIAALSTRLRDRKQSVRHETFRQLASLYKSRLKRIRKRPESTQSDPPTELSTLPDTQGDASEQEEVTVPRLKLSGPTKTVRKPGSIPTWMAELPNHLLSSHQLLQNIDDNVLLDDIENFVFEEIMAWDASALSDDELRLRKFAALIGNLNEQSIVHFSAMIARRAKIVRALKRICSFRLRDKNGETATVETPDRQIPGSVVGTPVRAVKKTFAKKPRDSSSIGVENVEPIGLGVELQAASNALSALIGRRKFRNEDSLNLCLKLCNFADRRFFEQLNTALSLIVSCEDALAASHDAISRVSSKSVLGEFVGSLVLPAARCLVFSVAHVKAAYAVIARYNSKTQETPKPRTDEITFLDGIPENSFVGDNDVMCGILRYIELTSLHFPHVLKEVRKESYDMVRQASHESPYCLQVLFCGLKVMSRIEWGDLEDEKRNPLIEQLRSIMVAPTEIDAKVSSILAKWATRALIQICKHLQASDEVWKTTLKLLEKELEENTNNAALLLSPFSALTQLAKHASSVFKPIGYIAYHHAARLVHGDYNDHLRTNFTLEGVEELDVSADGRVSPYRAFWNSSFAPSCGPCRMVCDDIIFDLYTACLTELCCRAVKLLVYTVHTSDFDVDDVDGVIKVLHHAAEKKKGDVFDLRHQVKDLDGNLVEETNDEYQNVSVVTSWNVIRLSCSSGMLYLARSPRYFKHVNPLKMLWALLCNQDPRADVRIAFARDLNRYVVRKGLPFRWIAALALMAIDPEKDNLNEVRTMLTTALRRKRNHIRSRLGNDPSTLRKLLPEVIMPVLIWLLAHHPEAETLDDFSAHAETIMDFLLDRLLDSNEYTAVIHEYLDALAVAKDKFEADEMGPATKQIHSLARACSLLLKKKQAGKKWNLLEHPGVVSLPGDLFQKDVKNEENSAAAPHSLLDAAKQFDVEVGVPEKEEAKNVHDKDGSGKKQTAAVERSPVKTGIGKVDEPAVTPKSGSRGQRKAIEQRRRSTRSTRSSTTTTEELRTPKTTPSKSIPSTTTTPKPTRRRTRSSTRSGSAKKARTSEDSSVLGKH